jgi:hypothetical protein
MLGIYDMLCLRCLNFLNNFLFWGTICTLRKMPQAEIRCLAICDTYNKKGNICHTLETQTFFSSHNCNFCHCQSNPQHVQSDLNIYYQISGVKNSVHFYLQTMHNGHLYNKYFLTVPSTVLNVHKWEVLIAVYWHVHAVHCWRLGPCTALNYSGRSMGNTCPCFMCCNYFIIQSKYDNLGLCLWQNSYLKYYLHIIRSTVRVAWHKSYVLQYNIS